MFKKCVLSISFLLIGLLLTTVSAFAISINLTTSPDILVVGDYAYIAITIDGLKAGNSPSLSNFDLELLFDDNILMFNNAVFGDQLNLLGLESTQTVIPGIGSVNLYELSHDPSQDLIALQADSFTLATVTFNSLAIGTSFLDISINTLKDTDGASLLADINWVDSNSITVCSTTVPEPATYLLLLFGLVVIIGIKKKGSLVFSIYSILNNFIRSLLLFYKKIKKGRVSNGSVFLSYHISKAILGIFR